MALFSFSFWTFTSLFRHHHLCECECFATFPFRLTPPPPPLLPIPFLKSNKMFILFQRIFPLLFPSSGSKWEFSQVPPPKIGDGGHRHCCSISWCHFRVFFLLRSLLSKLPFAVSAIYFKKPIQKFTFILLVNCLSIRTANGKSEHDLFGGSGPEQSWVVLFAPTGRDRECGLRIL